MRNTVVSLMTVVLVVTSIGVDMVTIAIEASAETTLAVIATIATGSSPFGGRSS